MSEGELREGLRAAVGEEPPLHFDPDELIQRAQHVRRRRRALVAVGAATLALTTTVLSLPGVFDRRQGIDAAEAPVLTTTASPPLALSPPLSPSPAPTTAAPQEQPSLLVAPTSAPAVVDESTQKLSLYLGELFSAVVPAAKDVKADLTYAEVDLKRTVHVTGFVHFVDAEGRGAVNVMMSASPLLTPDEFCAGATCERSRPQDDGSTVELATSSDPGTKAVVYSVAHFRTDGSVVRISAYNYDPTRDADLRDGMPVTTDQMVRLVTDPGLAVR